MTRLVFMTYLRLRLETLFLMDRILDLERDKFFLDRSCATHKQNISEITTISEAKSAIYNILAMFPTTTTARARAEQHAGYRRQNRIVEMV